MGVTAPSVMAEWGAHGVSQALGAGAAVIVIVDVLSFSTAVDVAVRCGAEVVPFPYGDQEAARHAALQAGARLAYPRSASGGQLSLSPASLAQLTAGERVLLPSPNGSKLSHHALTGRAHVLCGSLRNASAVAATARTLAGSGLIAVVPAGERWPDDTLRPAIEDLLGVGLIIAALGADIAADAEAELMRATAVSCRAGLASLIRTSASGRELIERGYAVDVDMALAMDQSRAVPQLSNGAYRNAASGVVQ